MTIQLIKGFFNVSDTIDIITYMIHVKIKFHENKINITSSEEDIKVYERRIKELQKDLFLIRKQIEAIGPNVSIQSDIVITDPTQ
jgi:hypothetical protein